MTVNLPQLRAFLAVVDAGGFSAAAAELGMSQSAVSHAVASLERELSAPLLVRAAPVRATELGARILPHARVAVSAARSVERVAADATATMTGNVLLAATPTVSQGLVPGLLRHWREGLPGVTVRTFEGDSAEVSAWLENGTADAAILIDPPSGCGVQLAVDCYRALLPRDHPLADEPFVDTRRSGGRRVPDFPQRLRSPHPYDSRPGRSAFRPHAPGAGSGDVDQHGAGRYRRDDPVRGVPFADSLRPGSGAAAAAHFASPRHGRSARPPVAPGGPYVGGVGGRASGPRRFPVVQRCAVVERFSARVTALAARSRRDGERSLASPGHSMGIAWALSGGLRPVRDAVALPAAVASAAGGRGCGGGAGRPGLRSAAEWGPLVRPGGLVPPGCRRVPPPLPRPWAAGRSRPSGFRRAVGAGSGGGRCVAPWLPPRRRRGRRRLRCPPRRTGCPRRRCRGSRGPPSTSPISPRRCRRRGRTCAAGSGGFPRSGRRRSARSGRNRTPIRKGSP